MSVEFEDQTQDTSSFLSRSIIGTPTRPRMISLVMKTGLVKTDKGGGYFLIGVIFVSIIASFVIFFYFVLGMTPTSFWNTVSGAPVKHSPGTTPILLKNVSPDMRSKIDALNKQQ